MRSSVVPSPCLLRYGLAPARVALAAAALVAALAPAGPAQAALFAEGFSEEVAFSGLNAPTAVRFAPDGRIFVAEKGGAIKVFDGFGDTTPSTVFNLSQAVYNNWDRGLLGLAIDPDFPTRPYIYVLYTYDADLGDPGAPIPRWNDTCPDPPGHTDDGCTVNGRLSRLQVAPDNSPVGSEFILVDEKWCQQYPSHSVGDLVFDALERVLYASAGDGASFNFVDWGQGGGDPGSPTPENVCEDPPVPRGGDQNPPNAEGGALRSQDIRTAGDPVTFDGTVIRIDPDTGAAAPGNPLIGGDPDDDPVVAFGLRNPFRMTARPGTNEVWVGDVGWSTWEEINRVVDGGDSQIENFGWPCYEGAGRQSGYDGQNLNICEALYADGANPATPPHYAYRHGDYIDPDPAPFRCSKNGSSSVSGLAFYTGASVYPSIYHDALFFADYSRDCLFVMYEGANGQPDPSTRTAFIDAAANPVDLQLGPDGLLYYVDLSGGRIMRVTYSSTNTPPVAILEIDPESGMLPFNVTLDASLSYDPDPDDTLTFAWDLDADGQYDDAVQPTIGGPMPGVGIFPVSVRVTDSQGESAFANGQIVAGNAAPVPQIVSPSPSLTWKVGDPIVIQGVASDGQDGNLPASRLAWEVILHHCPSLECHSHPVEQISGQSQITVIAPDHEWYSYLEIRLSATDFGFPGSTPGGELTETVSIDLQPRTAEVTYETIPPGLDVIVSGVRHTTPITLTTVVGSINSIAAVTPQVVGGTGYAFESWSDGGAAAHELIGPAVDTTITATYAEQAGFTVDYPSFSSVSGLALNGSAARSGSVLRLTPATGNQAGSAWYDAAIDVSGNASFFTSFRFRMSGGDADGADGMAFVIQGAGPGALGATGGGLGMTGISPSLAIELDNYQNGGDPDANHVGINLNGSGTSVQTYTPGFNMEDGNPHGVWVDYNGSTGLLEVFVSADPATKPASPALVRSVDLETQVGSNVWFGFTAGTGGLTKNHDVQAWSLQVLDSCLTTDATCNGIDDDCDGQVDEDFVGGPSFCGLGVCQSSGTATCVDGQIVDTCVPGTPAGADDNCNLLDEDCDGVADEDFPAQPTSCGVGACAGNSGFVSCDAGTIVDTCDPFAGAAPTDGDCDGIDDDCNGAVDDDVAGQPTTCGVGACAGNAGTIECLPPVDLVVYGSNRDGRMMELDLTNETDAQVDTLAFGTQAMELDRFTGRIYYYEWQTSGNEFGYWDPATGLDTLVRTYVPGPGIYGKRMAQHPDGTMYLSDGVEGMWTIDLDDGDLTFLGNISGTEQGSLGATGDFAFAPDGTLWVVDYGSVYTVDLTTLVATPVYTDLLNLPGIHVFSGVAFCDGQLYASDIQETTGRSAILRIDPATGATESLWLTSTYLNDMSSCPSDGSGQGGTYDTCDPLAGATAEVCDGVDNDCDGETDEGDVCVGVCTGNGDCDDGLWCNGAETCNLGTGACLPGTPPSCDDGIACTTDSCDEGADACAHAPVDSACDDGAFCNGAESCNPASGCESAGDPCPGGFCNEGTDTCDECAVDGDCDDGLFCNGAETCAGGACQPGANPCPGQACNEATDTCDQCAVDADCDDGLYCNGAETCDAGSCQAGTAPVCDDGIACTADSCDEGADACAFAPVDSACDDGSFCNGAETCNPAAGCEPAASTPCGPGEFCNDGTDTCDECAVDADCDDGLYCNGAETCNAGSCQAGTAPVCDDGIACTADSCDEGADACAFAPVDSVCDDGSFCNGTESCNPAAGCESTGDPCGAGEFCNDGTDTCDACLVDADCDDGVFCNGAETCSGGACQPASDPCPGQTCDEVADVCSGCTGGGTPTTCGVGECAGNTGVIQCLPPQDPVIRGANRFGEIRRLDLFAETDTVENPLPYGTQAMEIDHATGRIYYFEWNTTGRRFGYRDPATGTDVTVRTYSPAPGLGTQRMAQHPNGTMYLMESTERLYTIDLATGNLTLLGTVTGMETGPYGATGDMAFAPDGTLYVANYESIYTIDIATRTGTPLHTDLLNKPGINIFVGLAYCGGTLYAADVQETTSRSSIYAIDPATGAIEELWLTGTFLNDLSSCPSDGSWDGGEAVDTCDPLAGATSEICDGLDNDCDGETDEGGVCTPGPTARLESVTRTVGGAPTTVALQQSYVSPVVACTVRYAANTTPVVPRVSAVTSTSFDLRLQNPSDGAVASDSVTCLVVEEGAWTVDGVKLEAFTFQSTATAENNNWAVQALSYQQAYTAPVVLGQVMTTNDPDWSVFWCQGSSRTNPPSASALRAGKTVCEDSDTTRANETVGVIVFESGHGTLGGVEYEAALGADTVGGVGNSPPFNYTFNTPFASAPTTVLATLAGMDGGDGGWAYAWGASPTTSTTLRLAIDEDQIADSERGHTSEQVGYVVFRSPVRYPQ